LDGFLDLVVRILTLEKNFGAQIWRATLARKFWRANFLFSFLFLFFFFSFLSFSVLRARVCACACGGGGGGGQTWCLLSSSLILNEL